MNPSELLDALIDDAEDVLHRESGAQFRLSEMVIDEISYVDRAANKRRFLLIKRASGSGDDTMGAKNKSAGGDGGTPDPKLDDQNKNVLSITSETKGALTEGLTGALGRIVEVANAVKAAEEIEDAEKAVLPIDIGKQLCAAFSAVSNLLTDHIFKKEDNQAVEALMKVAETSMMLAEQVAEAGEITPEVTARTKQMSELLNAVVGRGDDDGELDETTKKLVEEKDAKIAELEEQVKGLNEKLEAQTKSDDDDKNKGDDKNKNDDPPVNKSDEKLDKLIDTVAALTEAIKTGPPKADPDPEPDPKDQENEVTKRLADLEKSNALLKDQLDKALETPPSRSTPTKTTKSDNGGRAVFPLRYNDPVHDPDPGA